VARAVPATSRGRRVRDAIVDTAARLMHERGIASTTVDEVLAASGTGKSQMYHYFSGKQDLIVAVLERQFERVLAAQPALSDPECADLLQWRDDVLDAFRESGFGNCPLGTFAGQVDSDPVLRAELAGLFARWRTAIAELVRRSRKAGQVPDDLDPDEAGLTLLTALQGGTMLAHMYGDEHVLARALDRALRELGGALPT
jgi:TetR/AcrR family transcriptional regulator, transcriptional repressor for nem operon